MNEQDSQLDSMLSDLFMHSESVIALLELFGQQVPAGFPVDDSELIKVSALVESAAKAMRGACEVDTIAAYTSARHKVIVLIDGVEAELGGARQETAALLYGLVWALQQFLSDHYLLPSEPIADDDVLEVIGDMITDLGPIETMAGMLVDQTTSEIDEEQLRASAVAVRVMVKSLCGDLISDHEQRQKARAAL